MKLGASARAKTWWHANLDRAHAGQRRRAKERPEVRLRWEEENRDSINAQARERYRRNPEPKKCRAAAYRAANPEKAQLAIDLWHEANPQARPAARKKWLTNNPDKARLCCQRRRIRLLGLPSPGVSSEEWATICEDFSDGETVWCAYCEKPATSVDHYIPIARRGLHAPDNVVPACKSCNSSKNDSLPLWQWLGRKVKVKKVDPCPER